MKKYKALITSSLVALMIVATPFVSFAENNNEKNDDNNKSVKVEQKSNIKSSHRFLNFNFRGKSEFSNSIFHRFQDWFTNKEVIKSDNKTEDREDKPIIKTAPVIKSITGLKAIVKGETETVTINAYDPNNKTLSYSANWGDGVIISNNALVARRVNTIFVQTATLSHVYGTEGTYTATFTVENSDGKTASSSKTITVTKVITDTTAPVISNARVNVNSSSATVLWNTDEKATSTVFYSTTTPVDTSVNNTLTVSNSSLVKNHSLNISNLTSNTLYHFVLKSIDASDNVALSSESSLMTTN